MKVLVAEDDTTLRIVLEKHLKSWGYEVLSAQNGSQAWDIIHNHQPQILLIDWIMPGMDGLELCTKIRSEKTGQYIYIVFLTSRNESKNIITALDAGADDYLCKPFDRGVLKSRMAVGARTVNYETQLQKSEERYRRITDSITDYIFTAKISDGFITEIQHNDSSIAVTGYGPAELVEDPSLWLEMVHNSDRLRVSQQLDRCTQGEKAEPLEYRIIRKDGAMRWVKSTIVQHFDRAGTLISYDCLIQDITEKSKVEREMIIARERAEESQAKLERLNLQLEITYKKLMETAHSAGMAEVAADVLHNVGNTLNSINVSAATIAEKMDDAEINNLEKIAQLLSCNKDNLAEFLNNDPQGKHIPTYLAEVSRHLSRQHTETVEKLQEIMKNVKQVKDIVRMQQSYTGVNAHKDTVLLDELIENAIEINSAGLERQNIEVIREYDNIGHVIIDRQRTLQVIVNLLDNAERALSKSETEPKVLKIRTVKTSDTKLKIEVIDNGIGINPAMLDTIFDRDYTTKPTGGGFGLHSSLIAAKDMQGLLTAKSEGNNCGATFILELPLRKAEVKNGKFN